MALFRYGPLAAGPGQFRAQPAELHGRAAEHELAVLGRGEVPVRRVAQVDADPAVHVHPQAVHRRDARTRTRTLPLWRRTLSQLSYIPLPSYRKARL